MPRSTGVRVQTVAIAARQWEQSPAEIAADYGVAESQVKEALAFYEVHQAEIDAAVEAEEELERKGA